MTSVTALETVRLWSSAESVWRNGHAGTHTAGFIGLFLADLLEGLVRDTIAGNSMWRKESVCECVCYFPGLAG